MVGDRLDTDILFGNNYGIVTLLVLSGVTSTEELFRNDNRIHPNYYADSIADLLL
jgi:ribonucleotide monophosphatase NagD (HAD superfamily)